MIAVVDRPSGCRAPNNAMDQYWCRCHELLGDGYRFTPGFKCIALRNQGPLKFPDRPLVPTKPATFDDRSLSCDDSHPWAVPLFMACVIIILFVAVYEWLPHLAILGR